MVAYLYTQVKSLKIGLRKNICKHLKKQAITQKIDKKKQENW